MEIPEIILPADKIIAVGEKIAKLKDSTDIDAFIVNINQPFYLQDRSTGGPYEVVCIIPQPEASGAGDLRADQDLKWLTYVVGCVIGNLDPSYLGSVNDIRFTQSDEMSLGSLLRRGFPRIKVGGIPTHSNSFNFDDNSQVSYMLEALITKEESYFAFTVLRIDTRYVVVADYSSGY